MNLLITLLENDVYSINAQAYRDPECDCFSSHLLSDLQVNQCDVASSYPEASICEEVHPCSYYQDKPWNGAPLSSVKSFHRDTAC